MFDCDRLPSEKCKYVAGSWREGDHPNPGAYMVCQDHSDASRAEYAQRGLELFTEVKGWYCRTCYARFGSDREDRGKIRERDDEKLTCLCRRKFFECRLCLTHTKKSYEAIVSRVKRYQAASMEKYGYLACGNCFTEKGNPGFEVWNCLSCNELCWEKSEAFVNRAGRW